VDREPEGATIVDLDPLALVLTRRKKNHSLFTVWLTGFTISPSAFPSRMFSPVKRPGEKGK